MTIQLDGAGRQLEDWLVQQAKGAPAAQEGSDGPVFVDESGRRSRRYRRLGMVVGMACAVYAVVILVTLLSGNSNAPWIPVPGQQEDQPAGSGRHVTAARRDGGARPARAPSRRA